MSKPLSRYLIALSIVIFMGSLSGCSTTSSGFGFGMVGSEAWMGRASSSEKTEFLRAKSLEELKKEWAKNYGEPKSRQAISMDLVRRGYDGQLFFDPAADYRRQADAQELGQAIAAGLAAGLQEVNRQNNTVSGGAYQNNVAPVSAFKNITYRQVGNTTYGSDGTSYRQVGNTTYGSDGTSYRQVGNTTYGSDGTSYRQVGNTTYGSDGTSYRQVGNTFYGTDGTSCRAMGKTIYCN